MEKKKIPPSRRKSFVLCSSGRVCIRTDFSAIFRRRRLNDTTQRRHRRSIYIRRTHTDIYRHKLVNQTLGAFWYLPCYLHHYTPPHGTTHIVFVYILCTRYTQIHCTYTQMYMRLYIYIYIYTLCSIFNFRVFIM